MIKRSFFSQRRRSRGQALVEFALVLPVLLILLMVLIEVARLFSAWLIVENSAREAARYAVTGLFNPAYCTDGDQCDSSNVLPKEQREALEDAARLLTIEDVARGAASGILSDFSAARDQRSFIDVVVCSNRPREDGRAKYSYLEEPVAPSTTVHPRCVLTSDGTKEEDAGGPGNRVTISVLFDHPVITPLRAIADWIPLLARREMIVEKYRTVRIQGLPPTISGPTATFTDTPTNTPTSTPTDTPTPTNTPTNTPTPTPTNTPSITATPTSTPTPDCRDLRANDNEQLFLGSGDDADKVFGNLVNSSSIYTVGLTSATVSWPGSASPVSVWHDEFTAAPAVAFDRYLWNGTSIADPANRPMTRGMAPFTDRLNNRVINPNSSGDLALDFTASLKGSVGQMYRHGRDWIVGLDYTVGNLTCRIDLQGRYGPVIEPTVPAVVSGPIFQVGANAYDPDPGGTIANVYFEVYDRTNSVVYNRTEYIAPYCLNGDNGSTCNQIGSYFWPNGVPIINGATYTITFRALDNDPHQQYTRVVRTIEFLTVTRTPSRAPTITLTPSRTVPPSNTPIRSLTPTPTNTPPAPAVTPSPTSPPGTPSPTLPPLPTWTPTSTHTPTATPTYCGFDGC
jgi:hypothetical protein